MEFIKTNVAKENTNRNSGPSITLNGGATGGATGGTASQIESHNLWGQPFDGTQDVSGTLENVENINMTGNLTTNGDININAVDENNNVSEKPVLNISVEGKNTKFSNSDKYIFSNEIDTNVVNADRLTAFNRTTTKDLTATGKSTLADLDATKAFIADLISNNITTDTLTVTEAAHFFRLIIDEIKSVGGSVILTTANAEFVKVEKINDSSTYRCYFLASQDNKKIENNFEENDMVTCRTFNVQQGVNENVNNKYYWALVTGTDYNNVTVNINNTDVECHYIDIDMSDEDADSNGVPEVGDKVAQLGNKKYSERQNAIIISSYQNIDKGVKAPSIVQYKGINDYNLATHRKTIISPDKNEFTGKLRVVSDDGTETNIKDYVDSKNYEWRIGTDGYWYLNGVITEYKAVGDSADKWTIGKDRYWYLNGVKTEYKAVETPSIYQCEFSKRNFSVIIKDIGTDGNTVVYDNGKLICDLKFKIKNSITNTAETVKSSEISFDCYDDKDNKVTSLSVTSINSDNEIEINNTNVQEPYYTANSPISYGILSYNHLKNSTDDANKYAEVLIPVMFATSHVFDITDERTLNMYQKSTQYTDNVIKTVKGQTSSFTQDIDKIRGDVSKNTTQINTLTGEVNKKVDSSTFEQRADQIDSRVRHAEMSANKSSNLFGFSKGITFTGCVPVIQAYGIYIPAGTTQVSLTDIGLKNEGGNFIVSFDAFTDRQEGVSMQPLLDGVQSEGISVIINEKKKYEFEFFNVKNVDNGLVINLENAPNIYISNIQIEKGNVATTFLPCKEDILNSTDANMISAISTSANFVEDGTETFGSDTFTVYKTTGQSGTAGTDYDFGTASNLELKKNTIYTLSFWLKGNNQNISGYSFKSFLYPNIATTGVTFTSAADNTDTYQEIGLHIDGKTDIIPINRWVKHYIYFYSTSDVTDKSVIALRLVPKSDNTTMPELRIADIQLRQGYWSEYMGNVDSYTESYINQKADEISLGVQSDIEGKLKKTGIDIDQNNITLSGDNTIVNGNLKLRNAEDGFTIYDDSNIPRTKIIADSIGIEDNLSINLSSPYSWKQYISTSNYRSAKINGDTIVGPVTDLGNRYRPEGTFGGKNATYVGPANTKFTLSKFTTESLIAVLGTGLYVKLPSLAVYLCDKNCENQTKLFDCTLSNENRSQSYAGANNVYWIRNVQTWTSSNTGTTTSTQQYIVFKVQPIIGVTTSSANGRDWSNYTIHMPSQYNMKDVDVIVNVTITPEIANENQQTVIGYDGLYSLLGDNKYLYMNKTNITMRWGNEGFRLDDNGIHQLYTKGTSFVWGPVGKSQVKVITNMSGEADINHNVYIYAGNTDVGMVVPESMKVDGMRITVVDKAGGNGYIAFSGASVVNYDNTKAVVTGGKLSGSFANPIELPGYTSWDFIYVAEINRWYMVK